MDDDVSADLLIARWERVGVAEDDNAEPERIEVEHIHGADDPVPEVDA